MRHVFNIVFKLIHILIPKESGGILLESTKPDITYNTIYDNVKLKLTLELTLHTGLDKYVT